MPARAVSAADLPDDVAALKQLVLTHAAREQAYESEVQCLREQLNLLLAKRYAASSEKVSPDQLGLFNEAEAETPPEAEPMNANAAGENPYRTTSRGYVSSTIYPKLRRPAPAAVRSRGSVKTAASSSTSSRRRCASCSMCA